MSTKKHGGASAVSSKAMRKVMRVMATLSESDVSGVHKVEVGPPHCCGLAGAKRIPSQRASCVTAHSQRLSSTQILALRRRRP